MSTSQVLVRAKFLLCACPSSGWAQLGAGNVLVSVNQTIRAYSPTGTLISTRAVPQPGGGGAAEYPRDLVRDPRGDIHLYNGTFSPFLSTLDADTELWSHWTHPGSFTVKNIT